MNWFIAHIIGPNGVRHTLLVNSKSIKALELTDHEWLDYFEPTEAPDWY